LAAPRLARSTRQQLEQDAHFSDTARYHIRHERAGPPGEAARAGLLCCMRGIGVPIASAILTVVYPDRYGVIDFRGWRQLFGEEQRVFSVADYVRYLARVRALAVQLPGWTVQETDEAIWDYDRRAGER
jgi:hypothetical protein